MNVFTVIGRLTKDPEVRTYGEKNDKTLVSFSIAVNRVGASKAQQEADFFNCKAFGNNAIFIEKYFKKGQRIGLSGEGRNNRYTNKDGVDVTTFEILVNSVDFADGKSNGNQKESKPDNDGFMDIPKGLQEELPFN